MEQDTRRSFIVSTRNRYLWGNRSSKHLARMLKKRREVNFIEKIQNKKGGLIFTNKGIAEEFRKYYEAHYAVRQKVQQSQGQKGKIEEFLDKAGLPNLTESDREDLDRPISEEEIYTALKDSASGKSPGPDGFVIF